MAQRYDTYKDSGVQWLGEIPGHWRCVPLKRICKMKSGNNLTSLDILAEGEFPVYGANGFRGYYNQYNKEGKYILIGRQGALAGNVHLVDGKFWATDHAVVTNITSDKVYVDYMSLALISMNLNQYAFDTAAQPGLAVSKIISFSAPLPPLSEQHSIASYLDDKCGKIDKMLEGKQKQIELLAEMKQRIIADAVTHGLNPDVKMKATNIPWLPKIPENWELRKMKYLFRERSEKNHPTEPMLSATQTHGVILQSKYSGRVVVVNTGFEGLKLVKVGDFVIHLRSFQGGIELAYDQGIISSAYTILSLNDSTQSDYFRYLFKSIPFIDLLKTCVTGIREGQNINYTMLKQNRIPLPPLSEQRAIVSYLDDKTAKIDTLTSKLQQEIESIKEYKQRLISDVVTGQIKVC